MTVLMAVYTSDGCEGRCDARCYNADSPISTCTCICGGANHGVGIKRATENTEEIAHLLLAQLPEGAELRLDQLSIE